LLNDIIMKKTLVIFAASSMLATGVSLAANVSFGQRLAGYWSEAFEFMGPISGLVHALVKPNDKPKARVQTNFQEGLSTPAHGLSSAQVTTGPGRASALTAQAAHQAQESGSADSSRYALNLAAIQGGSSLTAHSGHGISQAISDSGDNRLLSQMGKSMRSSLSDIAGNAVRAETWSSLLNQRSLGGKPLGANPDLSNKQVSPDQQVAQTLSNLDQIPSTNGINDGTSSGTAGQINAAMMTPSSGTGANSTSGNVPLPGGLSLVLLGALAGFMLPRGRQLLRK
jgi:hypothetical protein